MNETLYVRNLDEKTRIPDLKRELRAVFETVGTVLDVIAHKNLRMRGQAFVVFDTAEDAKTALEKKNNNEFKGRPLDISFARTKSDLTVSKTQDEKTLEDHKASRLSRKVAIKDEIERKASAADGGRAGGTKRKDNEGSASRRALKKAREVAARLPPHKILFIQDLAAEVTPQDLTDIYNKFEGFVEIRFVANRHLAFVEFEEDANAVVAKQNTEGLDLKGQVIDVTFAKK